MLRRVLHPVLPALAAAIVLSAGARATTPQESLRDSAFRYQSHTTTDGIQEIAVSFSSSGKQVPGVIFHGGSSQPQPGLVFLHDGSQGIDAGVKARCRDLAELGMTVFAPNYKGAKGTTQETPQLIDLTLDAGKAMTTLPSVQENKIGLMGTSQGGYLALRAAAEGQGMWRCVVQSSGAIDVAKTTKNLRTKVFLQHGWKDDVVALKHANHLNASLRKAGNACELKEYTMLPHDLWYWEDRGMSGDELSQAKWAWEDCTQFLTRALQPAGSGMKAR